MSLSIGDTAPSFTLPTDEGSSITLSELVGKRVIVYFYPKDATSGCTAEACSFRDEKPKFDKKNVVIIGISKDSIKSHKNVCEKYGVWVEKSMYGKKYFGIDRSTFLIDETGKIAKIWRKVSVPGHIDEILKAV
jgi:peroxiredoxin Q/BCP